jgi:hypothetical protein
MFCKDCITAKKKFRKGDQVIFSVEGCRRFPEMILIRDSGIVVGFSKSYNLVRILIDGLKRPHTYHAGFWERI